MIRIGIAASFKPTRGKLGLLGLHGCRHWGNWINKAGGLLLGGRSYSVDIHSFDCGYNPQKSIKCSQHLNLNKYVLLLLMLGGAPFYSIWDFVTRHHVLITTLLPSDLSPNIHYLIAPS